MGTNRTNYTQKCYGSKVLHMKIDPLPVGYLRRVVHIAFVLEEKGGGFDVVFLGSDV